MGSAGLFLIVIAFLFLYLVLVRPQKRRQLQQQRMLNELQVGAEVVTAGGIYGEITEVGEDDVMVRIAPQLEVRVARRAIAGVTPQAEPDEGHELEEPDDEVEAAEEPEHAGPTPGT
jgi:preprotein translocase subunit YajC